MAAGQRIDVDALHRYLWRRADRFGRYQMKLKVLASDLGLGYTHMSVVISRMVDEGRLRVIGGTTYQKKTYVVEDPVLWRELAAAAS